MVNAVLTTQLKELINDKGDFTIKLARLMVDRGIIRNESRTWETEATPTTRRGDASGEPPPRSKGGSSARWITVASPTVLKAR